VFPFSRRGHCRFDNSNVTANLMIPFTYRCPRTGQQVQGWAADDLTEGETYEPVTCTACGRIHLVNPKSGKVLESAKK
jgi:DNA-directed RNA polymerase subunit RPC12/RpoP